MQTDSKQSEAEWLRVREVQRLLGLSRGTTYKMIQNGTLRSRRFGRAIRIHRSAIEPEVSA